MNKELALNAASSPVVTLAKQSDDVAHPKLGSLQGTKAITLQPPGNDFSVRITSIPSDYIGTSIQIVVAIFSATASAMVIIWQMKKQKTLSETQHRANIKAALRLDAYRDFQIVVHRHIRCDFHQAKLISNLPQ